MDITFVEDNDPRLANVNETNCFNSTDIGFSDVYTITTKAAGSNGTTSGAVPSFVFRRSQGGASVWMQIVGWLPVVTGGLWLLV